MEKHLGRVCTDRIFEMWCSCVMLLVVFDARYKRHGNGTDRNHIHWVVCVCEALYESAKIRLAQRFDALPSVYKQVPQGTPSIHEHTASRLPTSPSVKRSHVYAASASKPPSTGLRSRFQPILYHTKNDQKQIHLRTCEIFCTNNVVEPASWTPSGQLQGRVCQRTPSQQVACISMEQSTITDSAFGAGVGAGVSVMDTVLALPEANAVWTSGVERATNPSLSSRVRVRCSLMRSKAWPGRLAHPGKHVTRTREEETRWQTSERDSYQPRRCRTSVARPCTRCRSSLVEPWLAAVGKPGYVGYLKVVWWMSLEWSGAQVEGEGRCEPQPNYLSTFELGGNGQFPAQNRVSVCAFPAR